MLVHHECQPYQEAEAWQTWRKFRITKKEPENGSVTNFYLEPVDGKPLPQFLPGQHISLQIPLPGPEGRLQSRQYSLSEAPTPNMDRYCISVKREKMIPDAPLKDVSQAKVAGVISNILHRDYAIGDEVELSPPRGEFYVDPNDTSKSKSPLVLLSAGVGAAPLRAILDSTLANPANRDRPVTWLHTARRSATICFRQHVRNAASKHDNLEAAIFVRDLCDGDVQDIVYDFQGSFPPGPVYSGEPLSLRLDDKNAEYYICGPEAWMLELSNWLVSLGVDQERQHLELFRPGSLR